MDVDDKDGAEGRIHPVYARGTEMPRLVLQSLVDAGLVVDGRLTRDGLLQLARGVACQVNVVASLDDGMADAVALLGLVVMDLYQLRGATDAEVMQFTREDGSVMIGFVYHQGRPPTGSEH